MLRFAARRLLGMVFVLVAISLLTFLIFAVIPNGDPAVRMAGRSATPQEVERIRAEWGFDRSLPVQYATTMRKVFTGDLNSYYSDLDVHDEIARGLPRTISLALGAAVLWMVVGTALGLLGAMRAGRPLDKALAVVALVGVSVPVFWLGALLIHLLGFKAGIVPNGGYAPLTEDPASWAWHLALPWAVLSITFIGIYSRVLRAGVLDTLGEEHVLAARARGLSERRVLLGHVLRNAALPLVALWGLDVGAVIGGGAILTESVFDLQGVGQFAAEAVDGLDAPAVLALTMLGAFAVVLLNTVVDIVHAVLDPRVRPT